MPRLDAGDVTVVVVTYNSAHCLPGLSSGLQTMRNIIVVDNASDDDLQTQLTLTLPQASLLRNARNLGFGAANNRAPCYSTRTAYRQRSFLTDCCRLRPTFLMPPSLRRT